MSDVLLLALANLIFAAGWPAMKYLQSTMGPVSLNLWTLGISIPALYPFYHRERRRGRKPNARLSWTHLWDLVLCGFVGQTLTALLSAWGANRSLASNGALISTCVPVAVVVLAVPLLGERFTTVRVVSFVLAIAGVLCMSSDDLRHASFLGPYAFGNLVLFLSCVANAVYIVYGKKLLADFGPMTVLFYSQIVAFLGSIPFILVEPFHLEAAAHYSIQAFLSLAIIGLLCYSWALALFYWILNRLDTGQVALFTYLQPLFGVVLSASLLGERITPGMLAGGGIVILSTVLVTTLDHPSTPE